MPPAAEPAAVRPWPLRQARRVLLTGGVIAYPTEAVWGLGCDPFDPAAVARLPVGQREVVTLVDLEGFAYAEVAEILEIPIGTVMSRLNRARKALQGSLRVIRPQPEDLADGDVAAQPARLHRVR